MARNLCQSSQVGLLALFVYFLGLLTPLLLLCGVCLLGILFPRVEHKHRRLGCPIALLHCHLPSVWDDDDDNNNAFVEHRGAVALVALVEQVSWL